MIRIAVKDIQPCSHCGALRKSNIYSNKIWLCRRHYDQYRKYGEFLDNRKESLSDKNDFIFYEDCCGIVLKNKKFEIVGTAIINIEDYKLCKDYKWYLDSLGYVRTSINNKKIRLHRFLLNPQNNETIDHINRNRLDCRRSNMRIVTRRENSYNRSLQSNNKSGISGVYFANGYWHSDIKKGDIVLKKYFKEKEDAINQRLLWEIEYFGEYAPQADIENIKEERL